ncbi:hypothetical protein R5R35_013142 [Gryllus longicercus]|uniref:Zinc finger PHD-type domain-containing protein n=1 Tax=Gryllus longicercus TaxID=2509291 RepID=A0AAN9ZII7_9ORTH
MGCDLQEHRARIGTWACRVRECIAATRSVHVPASSRYALVMRVLRATALCTLLIIGGVEQNPGPGGTSKGKLSCTACFKLLRAGAQCDNCGKWFHVGCNTNLRDKTTMKWICIVCTTNRELYVKQVIRCLESELQTANQIIREIVQINGALQEELFKHKLSTRNENTVREGIRSATKESEVECLILGDSTIRHVETDHMAFRVECFPGIRAEQLKPIIEAGQFGNPQYVILHVGTYDAWKSIDCLTGDVYDLVKLAQAKFTSSKIILSGVIRRRDMRWQRIRAINDNFDWVARCLGVLFVDPNSWVYEDDLDVDGVHLNHMGARRLGSLYCRICHSKTDKQLLEDNPPHEESLIWNETEDTQHENIGTTQKDSWKSNMFDIMRQMTTHDLNTTTTHRIEGTQASRNDNRGHSENGKNGTSATYDLSTALCHADTTWNEEEVIAEQNVTAAKDDQGATIHSNLGQETTAWTEMTAAVSKDYSSALASVPLTTAQWYNEIVEAATAGESDDAAVSRDSNLIRFRDEAGTTAACHVNRPSGMWNTDLAPTLQAIEGPATSLTGDWATATQEDVSGDLKMMTPIGTGRPITRPTPVRDDQSEIEAPQIYFYSQ